MKRRLFLFFLSILFLSGCSTPRKIILNKNQKYEKIRVMTTGYCKCEKCCGWERNWLFQPVYAYGKNKGKIKKVGITSSGTKAIKGTIAADLNIFPYGTIFYIPEYGWGKVEDVGSAIKGYHIDLFFKSHQEALTWGRKNKNVHVWFPN